MKITSIISEYNPFHEGHNYHLQKTKEITQSDYTIVIMSGNFTQRGTPAIIDKYARTKQALLAGADLVLELPVCFATASAEGFSFGAVSILEKLGVVDSLVFGSESGDIECIKKVADFLMHEPPEYKKKLQLILKQGFSFPKARATTLAEFFPELQTDFFSHSNNILGIEYCKALRYFGSEITPMTIARKDNLYHDKTLSQHGKLSSATAIRNVLLSNTIDESSAFELLKVHLPENSLNVIKDNWGCFCPVTLNDFSVLLKYRLLLESQYSLTKFSDVTSHLADRIYNNLNLYKDFESFCNLLKTKELTYTRINRSLLHILLDLKKNDYETLPKDPYVNTYGQYARILGFRKKSSSLLHEIKKHSTIPLISKLSDSVKELNGTALSMLEQDIQATHIYESVVADKFKCDFRNEYQRRIIII